MTDRHVTLTVFLDSPTREDDLEFTINAIRMIRGIRAVEVGDVSDANTLWALEKAKDEIKEKIRNILWPGYRGC